MSVVKDLEINLAERGIFSLNFDDPRFPNLLKKIPQPPKKIYFMGNISSLEESSNLGIVGARKAALDSKHLLNRLIKDIAKFKPCIVSGGATGIDMTAHVAALENSLATIIVLGSGILSSKFDLNSFFIKKLRENPKSLIISEFEPLMHAERWTFAYRNRLIAALSQSLLVVQAAKSSGSLITADYALKYKKNLYTLDITGDLFSGNQDLINSGKASPIRSSTELISILSKEEPLEENENKKIAVPLASYQIAKAKNTKNLYSDILDLLGSNICSFDYLQSSLEYDAKELGSILSKMEIKGIIYRNNQGNFLKTS